MGNRTYKIGNVLEVERIGLGTMRLTAGDGKWGPPKDKMNAIKVIRKAVELGINFFDTANTYGPEISENIIAEALYPYPDNIVIATKGGNEIFAPNDVRPDCSPNNLRKALHGSLKRLKVDKIDLYQLHTVDPKIDIEYSIEELAKLQQEEKIRFIGVSNIDINDLKKAMSVTTIHTVQNRFNFLNQTHYNLINFTNDFNIAFLSYYPLAKGELSIHNGAFNTEGKGLTNAQEALLWQLNLSPNVIPIPGTERIDHLTENHLALNYLLNEKAKIN